MKRITANYLAIAFVIAFFSLGATLAEAAGCPNCPYSITITSDESLRSTEHAGSQHADNLGTASAITYTVTHWWCVKAGYFIIPSFQAAKCACERKYYDVYSTLLGESFECYRCGYKSFTPQYEIMCSISSDCRHPKQPKCDTTQWLGCSESE